MFEEEARLAYINQVLNNLTLVDVRNEEDLQINQVLERSRPYADIIYRNGDGTLKFIEIKATRVRGGGEKCFGAITQSEMKYAVRYNENYLFVFMIFDGQEFSIGRQVAALELLNNRVLTCPPTKYYFNIDPAPGDIEQFNRRITTMVASEETINFHSELSSLMDLIASGGDIDVNMGNFLGLVTLLKMGNLRNEMVRNNLFQFMIDGNLRGILPEYFDY